MLFAYFAILIFILIAILMGVVAYSAGHLLGGKHSTTAKRSPYECGFEPVGNARMPFDVRFYLVAILFILFDLETAFFIPWAVVLRHIGWTGFWAMMLFLAVLLVGFIYEWKRGALEWE